MIEIANDARIDIVEELRKVIAFHLPVALEEKFVITIDARDAQRFRHGWRRNAFVKGEVGRF